jgi:hypothetical protein
MSKDGDWIIREDEESLNHVLDVLSGFGAKYRFGAPLDIRWLKGGWPTKKSLSEPRVYCLSSHTELREEKLTEIRDEFLSEEDLDLKNLTEEELYEYWNYWLEQAQAGNDLDRYTYSHGVFVVEPHDTDTAERKGDSQKAPIKIGRR